jgi:hypothetical protein
MKAKINEFLLELCQTDNKSLIISLVEQNQISFQTAERWIKTNDRLLLLYPNVLILMDYLNNKFPNDPPFEIQNIVINS